MDSKKNNAELKGGRQKMKRITKIVAVISAVSAAFGILLCIAGAAADGRLSRAFYGMGVDDFGRHGHSYSINGDEFYDDFYDDFFGDDFDDFFNEFNVNGGDNDETSL